MQRRPFQSRSARSAFTLVELMVVVVIMGIIAVSTVPAMNNVIEMRAGAARDDVARLLEIAKGRAMASGNPVGLEIDLADSTLTLIHVTDGGSIEGMPDPLTGNTRTLSISNVYQDVTISGLNNGDGNTGSGIIWFDFEATPHTRNANGTFVELNADQATITLSSGLTVIVHPYSGFVEKP